MQIQTTAIKGLKWLFTRSERSNLGIGQCGNGFDSEWGYVISEGRSTPKVTPKIAALSKNALG